MKKQTAVTVWEKIKPILAKNRDLFIKVDSPPQDLRLEDADTDSDFFFEFRKDPKSANYIMKYKPASPDQVRELFTSSDESGLVARLSGWFDILHRYNAIDLDFEYFFYSEFYTMVKSQEPDADSMPYDTQEQLAISGYIDSIKDILENLKAEAPEAKQHQLTAVIAECDKLQERLPDLTKNQVLGKLARIWAKAKKAGLSVLKDLALEFKKGAIKAIVEGGIDSATEVFSYF